MAGIAEQQQEAQKRTQHLGEIAEVCIASIHVKVVPQLNKPLLCTALNSKPFTRTKTELQK